MTTKMGPDVLSGVRGVRLMSVGLVQRRAARTNNAIRYVSLVVPGFEENEG